MSANDPKRTSPSILSCSSEAGLGPYQSTRLRRTMPSPEPRSGHEAAGISRCSWWCGGGLAAACRAQQPAMPVVGFLRSSSLTDSRHLVTAFRQGLNEAGFVEGQNVAIEFRAAEGQNDRLPALVADLIRRPVAVIVGDTISTLAAKAATSTVPSFCDRVPPGPGRSRIRRRPERCYSELRAQRKFRMIGYRRWWLI